jgi:hypothetical protein
MTRNESCNFHNQKGLLWSCSSIQTIAASLVEVSCVLVKDHTASKCLHLQGNAEKYGLIYVNMTAFWGIVPCSLIEVDQHFRGVYCLHNQGTLMMEAVHRSETSV